METERERNRRDRERERLSKEGTEPPYHNTPDKCQPPRIKANSPQILHHRFPFRGRRHGLKYRIVSSKPNSDRPMCR